MATAKVQNINYENEHDVWRYYFHEATEKQQIKRLKSTLELPSYEINNLKINVFENQPRADLAYDLEINRFTKRTGRRIFMKPNLLNQRTYIPSENIGETQKNIERQLGFTHIDTIHYQMPPRFKIESLTHDHFELETAFGKYEIKINVEGSTLTYIRQFQMYAFSLPSEKMSDLKDFYSKIVKTDAMKIVLVQD